MDRPVGMRPQELLLTPGQKNQHGLIKVSTYLDRNGSGWIRNEGMNEQLCGSLIIHRRFRRTKNPTVDQIVPIDSFLLQFNKVDENIGDELDAIAGSYDTTGHYQEGEIEKVEKSRYIFLSWLTRSPEQEEELKQLYGTMAARLVRARNPANQVVGNYAERMQDLKDDTGRLNPRGMLFMIPPLQKAQLERRDQLIHDGVVNESRGSGFSKLIYEESLQMAKADNILEHLTRYQNEEYVLALKGLASHVRFRVQVFNRLGYELKNTKGNLESPEPVAEALSGHRFMPNKNFLSKTAREIIKGPRKDGTQRNEEPIEGMETRLNALENMQMLGPYGQLQERLLTLGDIVLENLKIENTREAKRSAKDFLYLLTYHCLKRDHESDKAPWFAKRLS